MEENKKYLCGFDMNYNKENESEGMFLAITFHKEPQEQDIRTICKELNEDGYEVKDCYMICDKDLNIVYQNDTLQKDDLMRAFDWMEANPEIEISSKT